MAKNILEKTTMSYECKQTLTYQNVYQKLYYGRMKPNPEEGIRYK